MYTCVRVCVCACVCVCVFAFVMRLLFSGKSPRANLHPLIFFSGYLCVHHWASLFISMSIFFQVWFFTRCNQIGPWVSLSGSLPFVSIPPPPPFFFRKNTKSLPALSHSLSQFCIVAPTSSHCRTLFCKPRTRAGIDRAHANTRRALAFVYQRAT